MSLEYLYLKNKNVFRILSNKDKNVFRIFLFER